MTLSNITREDFLEKQLNLIKDIQNGDSTWSNLADMRAECLGEQLTVDSIRRSKLLLYDYLEAGWVQKPALPSPVSNKKSISVNGDGSQSSEGKFEIDDENELKDSKYLLELHGYDSSQWELVNSKSSHWDTQVKGGEIKKLYASKVTVKPKGNTLTVEDYKTILSDVVINNTYEDYEHLQYKYNGKCLVPTLFDVHFSKLCHNSETGNNYDYKIARSRLLSSVDEYIRKIQGQFFERIILPIGNDYFNSEFNGLTTGLTAQDNDSRYYVMYKKGVQCLIEVIEKLKVVAPLEIVLVQGNHDFHISFSAAYALELKYENDNRIIVDSNPTTRKYRLFGKNLFGFTHGSDEKERLFTLMQSEVPDLWGKSLYRDWFTGHFHKLSVEEKGGVTKWSIPSLCASDAWHTKMGFVESLKRTMCFVYDKEIGLTDIMFVNI